MTNLPIVRKKTNSERRAKPSRHDAESSLVRAFTTFTQAADSLIEEEFFRSIEGDSIAERSTVPAVPLLRRALDGLQCLVDHPTVVSSAILLCNRPARFPLRPLFESLLPRVVALASMEIPPGISVPSLGVVR